jgi:hypothetical protein
MYFPLRRAIAIVSFVLFAAVGAAQSLLPADAVNFFPAEIHPGDVVRVEVAGAVGFTLNVFGKHIEQELIGIDLETKPGRYPIRVQAADGRVATRDLIVAPKAFPIRRLRVAPKFVEPSPSDVERIAAELKKTEGLFHTTTRRRWNGAFLLPVEMTPTGNFGSRSYYNGQRRSAHAGVDFGAPTGTPIRAANAGTIVLAEPLYFTGNTVIVDHGGGLLSLFAHLSEFRVKAGDAVEGQTVVGLVGATGRVTGPHLHWSVRLQGARVDPLSLVAATSLPTK